MSEFAGGVCVGAGIVLMLGAVVGYRVMCEYSSLTVKMKKILLYSKAAEAVLAQRRAAKC